MSLAKVYPDYIKMADINTYLVNKASVKSITDNSVKLELVHYDEDDRIIDTIKVKVSDYNATVVHDRKKITKPDIEDSIYSILRDTKVTEFYLKDGTLGVSSGKLTQTIREDSLEKPNRMLDDINSILELNCALASMFHHRFPITSEVYSAKGLRSLKDGLKSIDININPSQKQKVKR